MKRNIPHDVFIHIDMHLGDRKPCWEWLKDTGMGRDNRPYFHINGKKALAYRVAYECVYGPVPAGKILRHTCDNNRCCNPHHLILGDHADNMRDMRERGRHGLPHYTVRLIRRNAKLGRTHAEIAEITGLPRRTITAIVNRETYKDVSDNDRVVGSYGLDEPNSPSEDNEDNDNADQK